MLKYIIFIYRYCISISNGSSIAIALLVRAIKLKNFISSTIATIKYLVQIFFRRISSLSMRIALRVTSNHLNYKKSHNNFKKRYYHEDIKLATLNESPKKYTVQILGWRSSSLSSFYHEA